MAGKRTFFSSGAVDIRDLGVAAAGACSFSDNETQLAQTQSRPMENYTTQSDGVASIRQAWEQSSVCAHVLAPERNIKSNVRHTVSVFKAEDGPTTQVHTGPAMTPFQTLEHSRCMC